MRRTGSIINVTISMCKLLKLIFISVNHFKAINISSENVVKLIQVNGLSGR